MANASQIKLVFIGIALFVVAIVLIYYILYVHGAPSTSATAAQPSAHYITKSQAESLFPGVSFPYSNFSNEASGAGIYSVYNVTSVMAGNGADDDLGNQLHALNFTYSPVIQL